jgi:hydroxypyruvate isomerase
MLRFSANLSLLFTEWPLLERFEQAKRQGFDAVEIQFPYQLSPEQIQHALITNDLKLVLFNVDADDLLQGGEGLAAVPEKQRKFRQAVEQALIYAHLLKPEAVNILPGCCHDPQRLADYLQTLKQNLHYAAAAFAAIGVKTVFEAINSYDMPGFIVDSSEKMLSIFEEVQHPNLCLQYDIYHMMRMQEDCQHFFLQHLDKIGHIQFADCPGRGEPGTGKIDFAKIFQLLTSSDYPGWIGAEYKPKKSTLASLGWLKSART